MTCARACVSVTSSYTGLCSDSLGRSPISYLQKRPHWGCTGTSVGSYQPLFLRFRPYIECLDSFQLRRFRPYHGIISD
jgi:hypothetical protein